MTSLAGTSDKRHLCETFITFNLIVTARQCFHTGLSVRGGGGYRVTITHYALDLTVQAPP